MPGTREVKKGVLRADPPGGADIVLGRPIPQQDDLIAHPIARSQLHKCRLHTDFADFPADAIHRARTRADGVGVAGQDDAVPSRG